MVYDRRRDRISGKIANHRGRNAGTRAGRSILAPRRSTRTEDAINGAMSVESVTSDKQQPPPPPTATITAMTTTATMTTTVTAAATSTKKEEGTSRFIDNIVFLFRFSIFETTLNLIYNVLFVSCFCSCLFASLCTVLLIIMFLFTYFLSLPELVNFYLGQQKTVRKEAKARNGEQRAHCRRALRIAKESLEMNHLSING